MAFRRSFAARALWLVILSSPWLNARVDAAETLLRWKFKTGDTFRYELRQKNQTRLKGDGAQGTDSSNEMTAELTWKVNDVDQQGEADITLIVQRVRSEIRVGPQVIKFDSNAKNGEDPGAGRDLKALFEALIGANLSLRLDARGQVIEAKVPAKITEALQDSPFVATADAFGFFSEKGVKNLFAHVIPVLPETLVEKGASWSSKLEIPVPPMQVTLSYNEKLQALEGTWALLYATIETAMKAEANSSFSIVIKKQSGHRVVAFDTSNGRVTTSTVKQSIELTLKAMNRETEQVITIEDELKTIP